MGWSCDKCGGRSLVYPNGRDKPAECYDCYLEKRLHALEEAVLAIFDPAIKHEWHTETSRAAERFRALQLLAEGCAPVQSVQE